MRESRLHRGRVAPGCLWSRLGDYHGGDTCDYANPGAAAASTGKNVVRIELTKFEGRYTARVSNFATGFKHPLPIVVAPDGSLLIGDHGAGTVLRVSYTGS